MSKLRLITYGAAAVLLMVGGIQANAQSKKNQRLGSPEKTEILQKANTREIKNEPSPEKTKTVTDTVADNESYRYEFSQPQFLYEKITIKHNAAGRGSISYLKKNQDEITENLVISPMTLEKLKNYFKELKFLETDEQYQSERQYSHLGTVKIFLKTKEKSRETEFNWTENKTAEALANEYRKVAEQAIWVFETDVARENQPLETPKQADALDSLLRRGMIADFAQIEPFLKELSNDERLPLIARNHLLKIIKQQNSKK